METNVQTCHWHPDRQAGVICQRCDRPICPSCMHQASVGFHCPECTRSGAQKVYRGPAAFEVRPILTFVLIGLNVAVFALVVAIGGASALGGSTTSVHVDLALVAKLWQQGDTLYVVPLPDTTGIGVGEGQWYRLVTSGFLHYGAIHIAFNMYVLYVLGPVLERSTGRLRFGLIYGVSMLGGSLGALLVDPQALTAGASGAIFGLMGALVLAYRSMGVRIQDSPVFGILMLNLVITFLVSGISVGGHVGGLVGGLATGWLFYDLARRSDVDKRLPVVLAGGLAVALALAGVVVASGFQPG
ncbi:MAG: rhomboid family intramembrane serine protease [Acidimicrobiales bacterium]|nr:rhomboid family intramembrane serine protease [Acidimicrobiales bacterium]